MTTKRQIEVQGISVEVVRKGIKNLHLGVYPPDGKVRVAAPLHLNDEAIRLAIISRLSWIRRKQTEFRRQSRQSQREMVTGESHYYRGQRFRLDVIVHPGRPGVRLQGNARMRLLVSSDMGPDERRQMLDRWYRQRLRQLIPPLLAKWEARTGISVSEVRIRKMKTRWGSCNAAARRVWLNLELIKKAPSCLEYVVVHEMVHLTERLHNDRFVARMDELLPNWRIVRETLNQAPLGHEVWHA